MNDFCPKAELVVAQVDKSNSYRARNASHSRYVVHYPIELMAKIARYCRANNDCVNLNQQQNSLFLDDWKIRDELNDERNNEKNAYVLHIFKHFGPGELFKGFPCLVIFYPKCDRMNVAVVGSPTKKLRFFEAWTIARTDDIIIIGV